MKDTDFYKSLRTDRARVKKRGEYYALHYRVKLDSGSLSTFREKRLCKTDVSIADLTAAFNKATEETQTEVGLTFSDLWEQYKRLNPSFRLNDKGEPRRRKTKEEDDKQAQRLATFFGNKPITEIKLKDITHYVDNRVANIEDRTVDPSRYENWEDAASPTSAKKEKGLFSRIMFFGARRELCDQVPTDKLKVIVPKREKGIFDFETWDKFLTLLHEIGYLYVVGAYLLAARRMDMIQLDVDDVKPNGIYIQQSKTDKKQIKGINADIEQWLNRALARWNRIRAVCERKGRPAPKALLCKENGERYGENGSGVASMFRRAKELWPSVSDQPWPEGLTYHSLKHTSITEFDEEATGVSKQKFSGHKSSEMADHYDHSIDVVPSNTMLKPKKDVAVEWENEQIKELLNKQPTHLRVVK